MKKIILLSFLLGTVFTGIAQNTKDTLKTEKSEKKSKDNTEIKTLLGKTKSVGAYGAFNINYGQIDGKDAILTGGRGAIIFNHSLSIGLGGYGFANDLTYDYSNLSSYTAGGYGGLYIEPIIGARYPIHVAIPILLGAGGVTSYKAYNPLDSYYYENPEEIAAFYVVEPGVEIEMNLLKFFRIGLGATYRYTSEIISSNLDNNMLHGLSYGASFKFGKF